MKNYFGVMLDCSRNAVMSVEALKRFMCDLERMDYNALLLYTEDTYELPDYPLFGKFRGRYSQEELKEIDAYAKKHGIELIPCIQTLAHLDKLFAWPGFEKYRDCLDILLAGDERVYELIDGMFAACEECFSSKRVHIGMDEAHFLGLGNYALRHGVEDRLTVFGNHLKRVTELAKKHGLQPMIWSDMAFRLSGGSYEAVTGREGELEKLFPEELELVYWDYYSDREEEYEVQIRKHEQLHRPLWFAGGAWKWTGFASGNRISMKRTAMAFQACKNHGISNIFLTLWGDNGNECPAYAVLPTLFYASELRKGNDNIEAIEEKFKEVFGEEWDDCMLFDLAMPETNANGKKWGFEVSKAMLYNDCFLGRFDSFVFGTGEERKEYLHYAERLERAAGRSKRFKVYFESYGAFCRLLAEKYDLGYRTRRAYVSHDKKALGQLVGNYEKTANLVGDFLKAFCKMWNTDNKPQGFEVQEIRLGGLKQRLGCCRERIAGYLAGDVEKIDELEESVPDYFFGVSEEERNYIINHYCYTVTVNGL